MSTLSLLFLQTGVTANQPAYFFAVFIVVLVLGGLGWLIATVLGFARARAFGAATRWFTFSALCLLLYHLQWVLTGIVAILGAQQNDQDSVLKVGAFMNVFIVLSAGCAIMGFVRLTSPR